jgi:hypothetical protein
MHHPTIRVGEAANALTLTSQHTCQQLTAAERQGAS